MEDLTSERLVSQTHEQNVPAHCQEALKKIIVAMRKTKKIDSFYAKSDKDTKSLAEHFSLMFISAGAITQIRREMKRMQGYFQYLAAAAAWRQDGE